MPKNEVSDPITDQEIAFALLILSGTMTDQRAAQAVGLNPRTAAYTKAKPRVRAYMHEHQAAVREQVVEQEVEGQRRLNLGREQVREQVLDRLREIANLSPEMTRGSITGQVKALSMIVAMQGLIPDRAAAPANEKSASPAAQPQIDAAAWLAEQQDKTRQAETNDPPTSPVAAQEAYGPGVTEPELDPGPPADASPDPAFAFAPDTRVPFSIKRSPFAQRNFSARRR